jgi:hypothetical protein
MIEIGEKREPGSVQIYSLTDDRRHCGLSLKKMAEVMGISSPTVQREWRAANLR